MAKHREGFCQLCGGETEVLVIAYRDRPFIDGRNYRELCFPCSEVPKTSEYFEEYRDENGVHREVILYYNAFDQEKLHSVEEMMEDGFGREESKRSIKAVKAAVKSGVTLPKPVASLTRAYPPIVEPPKPPPKPPEEDMGSRRKRNKRRGRHGGPQPQHQNKYPSVGPNVCLKKKHRPSGLNVPMKTEVTIREIEE